MEKKVVVIVAVGAIVFFGSICEAGFLSVLPQIVSGDSAPGGPRAHLPSWSFIPSSHPGGPAWLDLYEVVNEAAEFQLEVTGVTDEDPDMHITKTVENSSGVAWTGYELLLGGAGVTFVPGSASSDRFTVVSEPDLVTLVFSEPSPVLHGESVTFDFDLHVTTIGLFSFDLTQTPIPEPATVGLLGIGAVILMRRRKR